MRQAFVSSPCRSPPRPPPLKLEKIEFVGGIFTGDEERLIVPAVLLENLGIDKAVRFGNQVDRKAAVAELE